MKKTTAYSTFKPLAKKMMKGSFRKFTEDSYCEFASKAYRGALSANPSKGLSMVFNRDSVYAGLVLEYLWHFRPIKHFFLDHGVADFCAESVKECSEEYSKRLPLCDPVDMPSNKKYPFVAPLSYFSDVPENKMQGGFAIYFPAKENRNSLMVIPEGLIPAPTIAGQTQGLDGALKFYFIASDSENTLLMSRNPANDDLGVIGGDDGSRWLTKLVFGLSLYMDAFPDAVVISSDDKIHNRHYYRGTRSIVTRNEIVDEEQSRSVSPHWRRGHFRLLTSKMFIHKQGQTVYVRGAFVKGKAFDVLNDTPPYDSKGVK